MRTDHGSPHLFAVLRQAFAGSSKRSLHAAGAALLGALAVAGCSESDVPLPDGDSTRGDESALQVGGVEVSVPSPFVGMWIDNRRVELPLGLRTPTLPTGEELDPAMAELGNLLFFDQRLSSTGTFACATCHAPARGYAASSISVGVTGRRLARTTPSAMNRVFGLSQGWMGQRTLEAQSSAPFLDPNEMGLTATQLVDKVSAVPGYVDRFARLVARGRLGAPAVSLPNIERVLVSFQRLTLMAGGSRVDRYESGDDTALTPTELGGRSLFHGQARCNLCHSGPNYTDESFHNIVSGCPSGGGTCRRPSTTFEAGRFLVTGLTSDIGRWKTPTLRNVGLRGPYFHGGIDTTLTQVVHGYNVAGDLDTQIGQDPLLVNLGLSAAQEAQVVAFLQALSSPVVADPWLSQPAGPAQRESIYLSPAIYDDAEYAAAYPDVAALTPALRRQHWLDVGMAAGRVGTLTFSVDEYLGLYPTVSDAIGQAPDRRKRAFDDYLDSGRRVGRAGRFALARGFFKVQEYRALGGRATAHLSEEAALTHYLTTGRANNAPAAYKPTGHFIVDGTAPTYHYADGTSACRFPDAAAQRAITGRSDDVGVPRLRAIPRNLQDGGPCVAGSSPPRPSIPRTPPQGTIVPFSCATSGTNAACQTTIVCPSGQTAKAVRVACNLEFGTVSDSTLQGMPWNRLRVVRASDVVNDGHCTVDKMDISFGAVNLLMPPVVPDRIVASCREHDSNGGDCHLLGEMLCGP
ncbi:MAG: hypothetical protein JST00_03515 [Deltaproteobacteria bacterium]|nr:hypothetical protein [Deltaproteobacteria bacterium]